MLKNRGGGFNLSSGFTLAEVLITLGIIGIIAALTLPAVIANKKAAELQAGLKKNASVIAQAVLMAEQEKGESLSLETVGRGELKPLLMKHMKVAKDCGLGTESVCIDFSSTSFVYKTYDNKLNANRYYFDDGQFILSDGSFIMIENAVDPRMFISVDVNGFKKGPNRWGHDLFTFDLTSGKLLPMGAPGTFHEDDIFCSLSVNHSANGMSCTYKALSDKDYFKNLPK